MKMRGGRLSWSKEEEGPGEGEDLLIERAPRQCG